ncbi:MAG: hypothetical protein RJA70_2268 [Pseudomonadota bacterium]|jgi:hypothetical protein
MNFANSSGLWLLGLLAPLLVMYILKIQRKREVVASTWLWQTAQRDLQARHPFRRLRAQLPLLLQLLALVLLALAVAGPRAPGTGPLVKHLAIVVDISASMQTREAQGTPRLELAREAIVQRLAALEPGAEVMLISAGKEAQVLTPFERDRRRVLKHLAELKAQDVEGSLLSAVSLSVSRLRQVDGEARLLIVTDGALADARPIMTRGVPTEVLRVGSPQDNLAITRVDVVREPGDGDEGLSPVHVFASLKNHGKSVRNVYATLRLRNVPEPLASRQVQLQPSEEAPVVLTFESVPSDEGAGLIVELSPHDALGVDDVAYATVPHSRKQTVILSPGDKSPWLRRALLADPDVELLAIPPDRLESAPIPQGALLIYVGHCPSRVPPESYVVVAPPLGPCLVDELVPSPEAHQITQWNETDSRLRFLSLGDLNIHSERRIRSDSPQRILLESQHGALITRQLLFGREGTLVAFDFGESDWPLKASFVLFVRNLVEQARTQRLRVSQGVARTGEPLRLSVPLDLTQVEVQLPEAQPLTLTAQDGVALLPSVPRSGFHFFSWQGHTPGSALVPANLLSTAESQLLTSAPPETFSGKVSERTGAAGHLVDYSWLLGAAALGCLLLDVWYFTRQRRQKLPAEISVRRL